ncbi:MAG TPA: helix-turn-helix domain-containing protein [Myxococcota bacterium]|nr:helix-turn-helix domain-containing protein [Myxococcota bacterium]
MKSRRDENSAATRRALLRTARRLFAKHGFAGTGIEAIARGARVTIGALYHHFDDKEALLLAVAEEIEQELLARAASVDEADPWLRLRRGFDVLLEACSAPDVQRIVFQEAPLVLGAERWREVELRYSYGAMQGAVSELMRAGIMRSYPLEMLAPVLLALVRDSAAAIHAAKQRKTAYAQACELVGRFLESLRSEQP